MNNSGCSSAKMRQSTAHAAGGMVFGQPVRRQHVRKLRIAASSRRGCQARFFRPLPGCLLLVERISIRRFQRLIMRGQRPILKPAGHI